MRAVRLVVLSLLLWGVQVTSQDGFVRAPRLGLTFINSTDGPIREDRYQQALFLGAGWNRWPLYWDRVERSPGQFYWNAYDTLVREDARHGLQTNAILLGRPGFHQRGGSINGLFAPVFMDGTDNPGANINPANEWAEFVYRAVTRYKPGGILAQIEGWPAGWGIRLWEAWNEPDLALFWTGGVDDYARLLKVTYLAAHQADPQAIVMFGGLSSADTIDWLGRTLGIISQDPQAAQHNWYFDQVAVHSYTYARRSAEVVDRAQALLSGYGLERPIWLNETGVPVWDDYPGPVWAANDPQARVLRGTMQQQAAYIIQSAAYAWAAGADVVMVHQLYDDCGNQPGGSNFPPHSGNLCGSGALCWGDAHGLYRNTTDSACFSQHPQPGSPRPAAQAFRLLARVFGSDTFTPEAVQLFDERGVVISFSRASARERIHVAWNRSLQPVLLDLPTTGQLATLFALDGTELTLVPQDGHFSVTLPPATRDDFPYLQVGDGAAVGGPPFIIVEQAVRPEVNPALPQFAVPAEVTPRPTLRPTPGSIFRPTVNPAQDTTPPTAAVQPLPPTSPPTFTVTWSGQDDSGIAQYLVWVRVNGGDWQPWLETDQTQAAYAGVSGQRYEFAAWAVDLAGNWSANTEITPQAVTEVSG
jgi:hypothetical protein